MFKKMLLRIGLITGLTAALYPIPALFCCWDDRSAWFAAGLTIVLILAVWLGFICMLLLFQEYRKKPRTIQIIFLVVAVLLLLASTFWAPFSAMNLRMLYGIVLGCCYYGGSRLMLQQLDRLSHTYVLAGICIIDVFLGLICRFFNQEMSMMPIVWILVGNTLLYMIAHNLQALTKMLSSGREHKQKVPQEIRQSNFRIMTILCLFGVAILLLCLPLTDVLHWLGRWIYTGLWYLLHWLFNSNGSTTETVRPETVVQQMETVEKNTVADWVWLAIEIAVIVGVLVLVVWKKREIWHAVQNLWQELRRWIADKWHYKSEMLPEETGAYCDYVEDLLIQEDTHTIQAFMMTRHRWNRIYRRYLRMPQDAARYRLGYALALERLPEETVHASDSTGEILKNLQKCGLAEPYWSNITQKYDAVRYGETKPSADDFAALDTVLRELYTGIT